MSNNELRNLADEIRPLLEQRVELLEDLDSDYHSQFERLVSLDNDERKLIKAASEYTEYIDERVLWIRTGGLLGASQLTRSMAATTWLTDRSQWMKVGESVLNDVSAYPLIYGVGAIGMFVFLFFRWRLRQRLKNLGIAASAPDCRDLSPTTRSVILTILLSAAFPAIVWFIGWRLDHNMPSKFTHSIAMSLYRIASFAIPIELLRHLVCRGGLAEKHFEWSTDSIVRLRRHLRWFLPFGVATIGLVALIEATSDEQRMDSLGRIVYLIFALGLWVFSTRSFPQSIHDSTAATNDVADSKLHEKSRRDGPQTDADVWLRRVARLCQISAMLLPPCLVVLAWSGYFYTALQLTWRLQSTASLCVGLLLLRECVLRWITLERRRMAVLQAEELQSIAQQGRHPETDTHTPFLFPRWTWPDFRLNLTQIVTQIRSLLDTCLMTMAAIGLWFVWADVAPALNILDQVQLWQMSVEQMAPTPDGEETSSQPQQGKVVRVLKPITAANLGLALLIVSVAFIAGRNIPGLIEVILLECLSVDAGIRFATTCLVRYAIFITGTSLAFAQIGIGWNSVQWLVAAASVGLGFGLQEIFANFVSGIILLFERPMRVGDVITIGDTTGTVSR
ncbi:MAG: mechanosensitive ion channel, partial [Planctomycetes bacterium]|nr:mechanosensitive ion channel [Planctomycetota bacterium]